MSETTLVVIGTILTIFFGILASLISWFCGGSELDGNSKEAIRQMFNFQITALIIILVFGWLPLIGQLLMFVIWVMNIVFAIQAFNAAEKNNEVKIPAFDIVK